jgi:hypothetical protein
VPFFLAARNRESILSQMFNVNTIPRLVILSSSCEVITLTGQIDVSSYGANSLRQWAQGKSLFWLHSSLDGQYIPNGVSYTEEKRLFFYEALKSSSPSHTGRQIDMRMRMKVSVLSSLYILILTYVTTSWFIHTFKNKGCETLFIKVEQLNTFYWTTSVVKHIFPRKYVVLNF